MNIYQSLGFLVLGSRLRRVSENFLAEINRAYQNEGIDFEAGWFPVFYLLSQRGSLSIRELSEQTGVSHPAASQLITNLKKRDLVTSATCTNDGRKQVVKLTAGGKELLKQILPVWDAILLAIDKLIENNSECSRLLPAIGALENALKAVSLSKRIDQEIITPLKPAANG